MTKSSTRTNTTEVKEQSALFPNLIPSQNPAVVAFETNDAEASKLFHKKITDEPHRTNAIRTKTKYLKNGAAVAVSGITHSIIIIGAVGGALHSSSNEIHIGQHYPLLVDDTFYLFILLLSLIIIFANGVSTAYSDFLRQKEYKELYEKERKREMWYDHPLTKQRECDNYLEGEEREMIELYVQRGMSEQDAEVLVKILSKDKEIFVNFMMLEELELIAPDDSINPVLNAITIVSSSVIFGVLPLLPYLGWFFIKALSLSIQVNYTYSLYASYIIGSLALFFCGVVKVKNNSLMLINKSHFNVTVWWVSGLQMAFNGSLAFGISYSIGSYLPSFIFTH